MGRAIVAGGARMNAPGGILASDIAVGSTVKLTENGAAVDYLVVNQGIPSNSNLYDESCNGVWLLRKDIKEKRAWNSSDVNNYENSTINTWLNGEFFNSLGAKEQAAIKQVKIPYRSGGGSGGTDQSGANGLSTKIFLLSGYEVGWTTSDSKWLPVDGAKLDYCSLTASLNGSSTAWWLRSQYTRYTGEVWQVDSYGGRAYYGASRSSDGIRPALILPFNARFDKNTLLLKGVA